MSQQAYLFRDYWEDIGTLKTFFDANLALTKEVSCLAYNLIIIKLSTQYISSSDE